MTDLIAIRLATHAPQRLFGRFAGDELIHAIAPDMALEWVRLESENCERFSERICNDILRARGLPELARHGERELATPKEQSPLFKEIEPVAVGLKKRRGAYQQKQRRESIDA